MDSLSEFPALRSEPERGVGMFIMPENRIWYVPSVEYTITQGRYQLACDWERESTPLSYVRGRHP